MNAGNQGLVLNKKVPNGISVSEMFVALLTSVYRERSQQQRERIPKFLCDAFVRYGVPDGSGSRPTLW